MQFARLFVYLYNRNTNSYNLKTTKNEQKTTKPEPSKVGVYPTEKPANTALTVVQKGEEPTAEETTAVVFEDVRKTALNLAETMKLVEDLHLKKRHRDRLEMSIDQLDSFDIKHRQEDLDDNSYYSGCIISIKDDNRTEFITKNPVIIGDVVKYLRNRFSERLTEIEASIVLPQ